MSAGGGERLGASVPVERAWLEQLPQVPAQPQLRDPVRSGFFADFGLRGDDLHARSLYWSLRLAEEAGQWDATVSALPGYQFSQVGFLADSDESPFVDPNERFGVLAICDIPDAQPGLLSRRIEADGYLFPIGVLTGRFEPHVNVTAPYGGCVTGWACSRRSTSPRSGWLTAGHVVPSNQPISLSDGGTGVVVDRARLCVDAAVVSTNMPPAWPSAAAVAASIAPGDAVELHDQFSNALPMNIRTVDPALGATPSSYLPVRFSMDSHGQQGDSGALIFEPAAKEVAGMYLGQYTDFQGTGSAFGIGLSAHYLTALLDMEISL
jgi:hypothetical protein